MCGGPPKEMKAAAASQAKVNNQLSDTFSTNQAATNPYYKNLLENGLPYFNQEKEYGSSQIAQQGKLVKAAQERRLAGFGSTLPSGFAESARRGTDTGMARAFDAHMMELLQRQEEAKMAGAQGLNPLGYASGATGGNNSILQASSLKNNFWSNLVGGVVGGAASIGSAYAGKA